jgi:adenine phosphoribosyltransferase
MSIEKLHSSLDSAIAVHPNFPKSGIIFRDLMPVLANPDLFREVVSYFCDMPQICQADAVIGVDARGFLLASAVALKSSKPLLTARKPGKLPGPLVSFAYELEYGESEISMQIDLVRPFHNLVVIDDLLATGGTANAVVNLVENLGKNVTGVCVLVELLELRGAECLSVNVNSLIKY